jgi:hypothetical protein
MYRLFTARADPNLQAVLLYMWFREDGYGSARASLLQENVVRVFQGAGSAGSLCAEAAAMELCGAFFFPKEHEAQDLSIVQKQQRWSCACLLFQRSKKAQNLYASVCAENAATETNFFPKSEEAQDLYVQKKQRWNCACVYKRAQDLSLYVHQKQQWREASTKAQGSARSECAEAAAMERNFQQGAKEAQDLNVQKQQRWRETSIKEQRKSKI